MMEVILILYITVMVLLYTVMLVLMFNDKGQYIKLSCKALKEICATNIENGRDILLKEINRFYEEYSNENGKFRKNYPNVIKWLDAIIFRVDCGKASMAVLKEFIVEIK